MDVWQTAQNWILFGALAAAVVYYYYPHDQKPKSVREKQQPAPKTVSAAKSTEGKRSSKQAPPPKVKEDKPEASSAIGQSSKKGVKRKADDKVSSVVDEEPASHGVDNSLKNFAESMQKARQGVDVKKSDVRNERVRTVKPKGSATPVLSSGSAQVDGDDRNWSPVASSSKAGGVDDMLEPTAPGPTALRITASAKPAKEKVTRQPKQEVVETKKQRQNRQKVEQQRLQREEDERQRRALEEKQRRSAREARGEPAKNGIPVASAPATSPWSARDQAQAQQPAVEARNNSTSLLDTFDVESTSSSNDAQNSTAATSTTDGAPATWPDELPHETSAKTNTVVEGDDWSEVKNPRKPKKKQAESNGGITPTGTPLIVNGSSTVTSGKPAAGKPTGFSALRDEYVQRTSADPNDPSSWDA